MDVDSAEETEVDLVRDTYTLPPPVPLTFMRHPICKPDEISNLDLILNVCTKFCDLSTVFMQHFNTYFTDFLSVFSAARF